MVQSEQKPIVVKIIEPANKELGGLADVLLGSLGLTGVLVLGALVAALIFGSVLFWIRSRSGPVTRTGRPQKPRRSQRSQREYVLCALRGLCG